MSAGEPEDGANGRVYDHRLARRLLDRKSTRLNSSHRP